MTRADVAAWTRGVIRKPRASTHDLESAEIARLSSPTSKTRRSVRTTGPPVCEAKRSALRRRGCASRVRSGKLREAGLERGFYRAGWNGEGRGSGFALLTPEIRYARSGDLRIAYQVAGEGNPIDLVWVPSWASHLVLDWEWPPLVAFRQGLTRFCR